MDDAAGDEDVRGDDARAVDEDGIAVDGDGDFATLDGLEFLAVGKAGAVSWGGGDDGMVGEDLGDLVGGEATETGTDGLESGVGGSEDGHVAERVDGLVELGGEEGAAEGGEAGNLEDVGGWLGNGEDGVDDVDDAAGEGDILHDIRRASCRSIS